MISDNCCTIEIGASLAKHIVEEDIPGGKHKLAVVDGVNDNERNLHG
jgi:hypothetical protein